MECREAVLSQLFGRSPAFGLLWRGRMQEGNRGKPEAALIAGHGGRYLEETLPAHEVGLKARTERIAPPGNAGDVQAGAAQQRIVENGAKRRANWQLIGHGMAHDELLGQRKPVL